jgi:CDGSH-type Zn-finger protein
MPQTVQVNPDGTHSIIHNNGNTSTQVNPDGTHTVIFHNGNSSTQVNPDGTHTVIFHNGNSSTQVNPDGTHTVTYHQGTTSTQVNPDGTQTQIYQLGNTNVSAGSTGSINPPVKYDPVPAQPSAADPLFADDDSEKIKPLIQDDSLSIYRQQYAKEEFSKIKQLLEEEAIDSVDYAKLLLRIFNNIYDYENSPADQIMDLKNSFHPDSLSSNAYLERKNMILYHK